MPDLNKQPLQGGPTMPVYIMNGAVGDPGSIPLIVSVIPTSNIPATATGTSGTKAAAGNNTLLPAPGAGKRIVVHTIWLENESANVTTIQLIDQVARFRMVLDQYKLCVYDDWRLNENTALTLNLSGANSIGYSIQYSIENV
jgi:hypothetical protein